MDKRNFPFWLFIVSLLLILVIRDLFRDGMFMDGMIYTSVAHNLANGMGSFWYPHFSQTLMPVYHEQPPLQFGIMAIFFSIFGNSMYVERVYGLFILLFTIFIIHNLWKCLLHNRNEKDISWFPVLLLYSIPVCFWSFSNNMEEPVMGMFDLAALLFICKALVLKNRPWLNLTIASFMLIAASMCKGVQGLFPLASVLFYWLVFRDMSFIRMALYSVFLTAMVASFYGLIFLNESILSSYETYFNRRIVIAFTDPAKTHTDRFYILKQLGAELLPVFIISIIIGISMKVKNAFASIDKKNVEYFLWFLFVALSGTLPLMLTIEQSGYYLVTVMPYYALAFALLFAPFVFNMVKIIKSSAKWKIVTITAWIFFFASILFCLITIAFIPKRDEKMLNDVYCTGKIINPGSIIGIPQETSSDWKLHAYYSRYFFISLDATELKHNYFLLDKTLDTTLIPSGFSKLTLPTQKYNLYEKKQN